MSVVALLVVVVVLAALGAIGARLGTDSRPRADDPPEAQWPFLPRH